MALSEPLNTFLNKNRDILLFNRAMVVAGLFGILSGAFVAQLFTPDDKLANSLVSLLAEYSVDIPVLCIMLNIDKRSKYRNPTDKSDRSFIQWDITKLLIALFASEIVYSATKISLQYIFLQFTIEPYQASLISSIIGWIIFFVFINVLNKMFGLFRKQNDN